MKLLHLRKVYLLSVLMLNLINGREMLIKRGRRSLAACSEEQCHLPDCFCSGRTIPGNLTASQVPQLILITVDGALTIINFNYSERAFKGRKNPSGCPIGVTFFVNHEYTDYTLVNKLWLQGHEIANKGVSSSGISDYWRKLSKDGWRQELVTMREMLSRFAAIPKYSITGVRAPNFEVGGDDMFQVLLGENFEYDNSISTQKYVNPGLWPYTLDYPSIQECQVGRCPQLPAPGLWEVPLLDFIDKDGFPCSIAGSCHKQNQPDDAYNLLLANFLRQYQGNRAPFGIHLDGNWFSLNGNFKGLLRFLDVIQEQYPDAYIVTIQQALEWMKSPTPLSRFADYVTWNCNDRPLSNCQRNKVCRYSSNLPKGLYGERYMNICRSICPRYYPWLGNPKGI